ncbi:MAG: hypothetical protein GW823_08425 [Bacteroidetes bacterium]|nr:hypothetical protein [Bacteroidota bacterium]
MRIFSYKFLLLLMGFITIVATDVVLVRFNATVQSTGPSEIQLNWVVSQEKDVDFYSVRRKMSHQTDFQELADIQLNEGVDNLDGRIYQYTDKNVFKTTSTAEPVIYALYAIEGGSSKFVAQVDVNYTTTTVRRTWGSIKAMFQ